MLARCHERIVVHELMRNFCIAHSVTVGVFSCIVAPVVALGPRPSIIPNIVPIVHQLDGVPYEVVVMQFIIACRVLHVGPEVVSSNRVQSDDVVPGELVQVHPNLVSLDSVMLDHISTNGTS